MDARTKLTEQWHGSHFDGDCKTVEDYARRIVRRLQMTFGEIVPDYESLEQVCELQAKFSN